MSGLGRSERLAKARMNIKVQYNQQRLLSHSLRRLFPSHFPTPAFPQAISTSANSCGLRALDQRWLSRLLNAA